MAWCFAGIKGIKNGADCKSKLLQNTPYEVAFMKHQKVLLRPKPNVLV